MVDDHSKANDELKTLAQSKNITLPTEIGPEDKALRDRLTKLSGAAFDQRLHEGDGRATTSRT